MSARTSRRRRVDLGVDWHLPKTDKTGAVIGYAGRPFANTTVATSDLIAALAHDADHPKRTWSEIHDAIRYDDEAKAVARGFIDAGHGDAVASAHIRI